MLASKKPKDFDEGSDSNQVIEVDNGSTFAWTAESAPAATVDSKSTAAPLDNNAGAAGLLVVKEAAIMENTTEKDLDSTQNIQPVDAAVQVDSGAQNAEQMVADFAKKQRACRSAKRNALWDSPHVQRRGHGLSPSGIT